MSDEQFQLADGWEWATFEEVATVASDLVDPTLTPDAAHIAPNHIESWTGTVLPHGTIRDDRMTSAKHRFRRGQILYSKIRPYLAKAAMAEVDGLCSADMYPIDATIDARFLLRWMLTPSFTNEASLSQGRTVLPKINQDGLSRLHVPVAPLNEQRRIVEKLDAVFQQSRSAKARLERVPALLEKLKRSILAAAFRGDLTKDWRAAHPDVEPASMLLERIRADRRRRWEEGLRAKGKDPKKATYEEPAPVDVAGLPALPEGWVWARWDGIGDSQNGRPFPSGEYADAGVPLLRPGNLHVSGRVVWTNDNSRFMPAHWAVEQADALVGNGELVINLTAQSLKDEFLGRICMTSEGERCLLNQRIARLTPTLIDPRFLLWLFKSPLVRSYIDELNTGSLIQHMFTSQIAKFVLPIPPLGEQRAIAGVLDDVVTRLESSLHAGEVARQRFEALDRAALAKAFRGELVPQDPTDEPASVLLDRIRAARADEPQRARRGRAARAPETPAAKPAAARATNGHGAEAAEGAPVDLVVAAFQRAQRLTATAIGDTTGLDTASVKKALKALLDGGHVRVEGKARGTAYVWQT